MNEVLLLILTFLEGIALGIFFFYGLWITVKHAVSSKIPALWFSVSSIIRTGMAIMCFYYISKGSFKVLLVCLLGFITARFFIRRFTELKSNNQLQMKKEVNHES